MSDRSQIRALAAALYAQHNGKLEMQSCLNVAEVAILQAENVDAKSSAT